MYTHRSYTYKSLTLQCRGHNSRETEVGVDSGAHPCCIIGASALMRPQWTTGLKHGNTVTKHVKPLDRLNID